MFDWMVLKCLSKFIPPVGDMSFLLGGLLTFSCDELAVDMADIGLDIGVSTDDASENADSGFSRAGSSDVEGSAVGHSSAISSVVCSAAWDVDGSSDCVLCWKLLDVLHGKMIIIMWILQSIMKMHGDSLQALVEPNDFNFD